jgi:hypothetical protein
MYLVFIASGQHMIDTLRKKYAPYKSFPSERQGCCCTTGAGAGTGTLFAHNLETYLPRASNANLNIFSRGRPQNDKKPFYRSPFLKCKVDS